MYSFSSCFCVKSALIYQVNARITLILLVIFHEISNMIRRLLRKVYLLISIIIVFNYIMF